MRLSNEAEAIALRYGATVSKGIVEMEAKIRAFQAIANFKADAQTSGGIQYISGQSTTVALVGGMPTEYWTQFRKEMDTIIDRARQGY